MEGEIGQAGDDRVIAPHEMDHVVLVVVGVGDELPADHELKAGAGAERVAHAPVKAAHAHAAFHRLEQRRLLRRGKLAHGPVRHDEVERLRQRGIEQRIEGGREGDIEAGPGEFTPENFRGRLRLVAGPASGKNQRASCH